MMKPFALLLLVLLPTLLHADNRYQDDDYLVFEDDAGITVTGARHTTRQMTVITRDDIERRGATDIANILQETVGVNIARYGPHGNLTVISMRGFDSRRVAFLVNGIPVSSPVDGRFDIYRIDPASIERIEVVQGGSDSRFNVSGALGGVVNIITIGRQKPGLRFSGSVSNTSVMPGWYRGRNGETQPPRWLDILDTQNYAFSLGYGGTAVSVMANVFFNRAGNSFTFDDRVGHTRRQDNNNVWDTGTNVSLVWELGDLTRIISSSHFFHGDRNFPTSGFSRNVGNQQDTSAGQSLMLEMPRAFHDNISTEASLSWDINRRDYTLAGSSHNWHSVSAVNRWGWHPNAGLTLRAGFDYRLTRLDSTDMGRRDRHDGGVYITAELGLGSGGQFLIVPSVKAVATSGGTTEVAAIPKLGFLWNISDNFTVRNNYFRSFKFPDLEALYWIGGGGFGNPDLRPQDGWGTDLGTTWIPNRRFRMENVFFAQWTRNSIHWFPGSAGIWRPENVGEAAFFGLNSRVSLEVPVSVGPVRRVVTSLSHQYLLSYLLSYGHTFSSSMRIPYSPEHTVGVSLDIPWETGSLVVSGHFESRRFHDISNLTVLPPHFLLNAAYTRQIGGNFSVFASLRNILNQRYESFYNYPMPGITLTVGVRLDLEANRND